MTGPITVPPGIDAFALDLGSARGHVYSRHTGVKSQKPSSTSGKILQLIPASTLCQNDASSQTFVSWLFLDRDTKFWRHSRNLFRDAGSVLGAHINEFTSCEFKLFGISLFTFFYLLRTFPRLVLSHSALDRTLHTSLRLLHRYWPDLLSAWFGMRVVCSKHPHWSVWFLFLLTFSGFQDSRHWHLWRLGDLFCWVVAPTVKR